MSKFVFWGTIHNNWNIAFNEDLSCYAQGETFWKAMKNLAAELTECTPSADGTETDITRRQKLFYETGLNRIEIFVVPEGSKFAVKCANSRSLFEARDEKEALCRYVEHRADTSKVNSGGG